MAGQEEVVEVGGFWQDMGVHPSSFQLMSEMRKGHVTPGSHVLDVGGADVNGSYRSLFEDCKYTTLDWRNADIIVTGYDWPLEDETFDTVISGQALEHDEMFWLTMKNMARVLKKGGHLLLVVPSTGPIHRHPVDCYRFFPDSMSGLAKWSNLDLLNVKHLKGPWGDVGAVFHKGK